MVVPLTGCIPNTWESHIGPGKIYAGVLEKTPGDGRPSDLGGTIQVSSWPCKMTSSRLYVNILYPFAVYGKRKGTILWILYFTFYIEFPF